MSRSIHQTLKSVFHGKSKKDVIDMCDHDSPDPDVVALRKKTRVRRETLQERQASVQRIKNPDVAQ